jgi:Phytanoyl-CoA dioxygenase (PhyH)
MGIVMKTQFAGFRFASDENLENAKLAEQRVFAEIKRLGLERNVEELDTQGFTILHSDDLGEKKLSIQLRDKILRTAENRYGIKANLDTGLSTKGSKMPFGDGIYLKKMLYEDPIFEAAIVQEKMLALVTYLLGESCKLSHTSATIKEPGSEYLELHVDAVGTPAPLSTYAYQANATWMLTDYSRECGGTCFVPGSHKWLRPPNPEEGMETDKFEPIEAKEGSMVIWGGNTWHGSVPRRSPGLRVSLMAFFVRWNSFIVDDDMKSRITQEMLDRNSPRFRKLMSLDQPSPVKSDNPNIKTMAETQYSRFA